MANDIAIAPEAAQDIGRGPKKCGLSHNICPQIFLNSACRVLYSEGMQHVKVVEQRLPILNPLLAGSTISRAGSRQQIYLRAILDPAPMSFRELCRRHRWTQCHPKDHKEKHIQGCFSHR